MTLGQKLKKLRMDNNLTQKELADRLHVTFQTVSKWENDTNEPDFSTLKELSKIYDVSIEYLFSDAEENVAKEEPVEENKIHISGHICAKCSKDIPEGDIAIDRVPHRSGKTITYTEEFYHKACLNEVIKERNRKAALVRNEKASKAKRRSFGWGIAGGATVLIIFLIAFLVGKTFHPAVSVALSILFGYMVFADVYCILSGSYIADVFLEVATWSVKFPGIIFSFDIEGFVFLIAMKILFAVLGFIIGMLTLVLASILSAGLAAVSFPFVLIHNIHTNYENAI